jgi:hypothetical protein
MYEHLGLALAFLVLAFAGSMGDAPARSAPPIHTSAESGAYLQ